MAVNMPFIHMHIASNSASSLIDCPCPHPTHPQHVAILTVSISIDHFPQKNWAIINTVRIDYPKKAHAHCYGNYVYCVLYNTGQEIATKSLSLHLNIEIAKLN